MSKDRWRSRPGRAAGPVLAAACAVVLGTAVPAAAADAPQREFTIADPRITESSGLAASTVHPGVYWTHNDSDDGPYVYAVDAKGRTVATVTLRGVKPRDVEAISTGPGGQLYVADTGDNLDGTWPEVWIYRFAEPKDLRDQSVDVVRYRVRYEDGPRDAEALMVHPVTGRAYIASKRQGGGGLYRGPETLSESGVNTFRRIAEVPWVTDGAFSPDGTRLVLRGYFSASLYRWRDDAPTLMTSLSPPFQRQGESVTFAPDGRSLLYGSEGKDSVVWRAPLEDDQLPDTVRPSAAPTPAASGSTGSGAGAGAAAGTAAGASASPTPGTAESEQDSAASRGRAPGALLLVVIVVSVLALRKKRRNKG